MFNPISRGLILRRPTKAFTLIEAMAVVAIIGVLASLTVYVMGQAKRQARDARRKSDLAALNLAFQARYNNKVCPGSTGLSQVGYYPGRTLFGQSDHWHDVTELGNLSNDCGAFSEYLTTIPQDPTDEASAPYQFDLGTVPVRGKHFRLLAKLEKPSTSQEQAELARIETVWVGTFGGGSFPLLYNYAIGD